jgi:hypothetical protein
MYGERLDPGELDPVKLQKAIMEQRSAAALGGGGAAAFAGGAQGGGKPPTEEGELSFIYRYILRESCSQFDSLPLTYLTISDTGRAGSVSDYARAR